MAENTPPEKQIFLSYAWANVKVADEIDNDFKMVGIKFQRDVRDIDYTGSIKDFMNSVGKSDFVVMLISDEYIRSENCMYEVVELLNTHEFEDRILPVILDNISIFSRKIQEMYYDYWQEKVEDTKRIFAKHQNDKTIGDKKKIQSIYDYLGAFFLKISEIKSERYEALKKNNYKPILDKIGYNIEVILGEVTEFLKIKDEEERELAAEELLKKFPDNPYALFVRAEIADSNKSYRKAKKYYESLLIKHPTFYLAHYNLASILSNHFSDYKGAEQHYILAIQSNPKLIQAYNNLGLLQQNHFSNFEVAKKLFEKAINLNPKEELAYYNLALLLESSHFSDYSQAKQLYEKVLELNPKFWMSHFSLGGLLLNHFSNPIEARKHLEIAIDFNPNYANAHFNLALMLVDKFKDYPNAKVHFEKTIELEPQDIGAYNNLGLLLVNKYFSDYKTAKECFIKAIKLDPTFVDSYNNLGVVLMSHFDEFEEARKQFEKVIEINPKHERAKNNLAQLMKNHFS